MPPGWHKLCWSACILFSNKLIPEFLFLACLSVWPESPKLCRELWEKQVLGELKSGGNVWMSIIHFFLCSVNWHHSCRAYPFLHHHLALHQSPPSFETSLPLLSRRHLSSEMPWHFFSPLTFSPCPAPHLVSLPYSPSSLSL